MMKAADEKFFSSILKLKVEGVGIITTQRQFSIILDPGDVKDSSVREPPNDDSFPDRRKKLLPGGAASAPAKAPRAAQGALGQGAKRRHAGKGQVGTRRKGGMTVRRSTVVESSLVVFHMHE